MVHTIMNAVVPVSNMRILLFSPPDTFIFRSALFQCSFGGVTLCYGICVFACSTASQIPSSRRFDVRPNTPKSKCVFGLFSVFPRGQTGGMASRFLQRLPPCFRLMPP